MPRRQRSPGGRSRYHLVLLVIAAALSFACSANKHPSGQNSSRASTPPAVQASPQTNASPEVNKSESGMPARAEVDEAVKRVCVNAVTIDTSQSTPFIVGDFNGDGSEDLAVIVRPAPGALPRLNSEYANWISEDPRKVVLPDPNKAVQRLPKAAPPVIFQANDLLLLILHGYQQAGWHHQYARQTYMLRNAVGENMCARSVSEVSKTDGNKNPLTQRPGDVIGEKLTGHDGFLYWTNGRYAWWNGVEQ